MGLSHPEDVVDGSGSQDLPHGLINYICILSGFHLHGAEEAHNKELMQDRIWKHRQ